MKLIDISPVISAKTAVFPGDTVFSRNVLMDFPQNHLALSSITTTVHIGAHADAPNHYHAQGKGMHEVPLDNYYGDCQVVEVNIPRAKRILPEHCGVTITAKRVLFKTGSFPNPNHWNSDFNSLSPELIHWLAGQGVCLVGIDTPSVDPETSKTLESHQALFTTKMSVLEGVVLVDAPAGIYTLSAFPLRLENCDASPVRAVLIKQ